MKNLEEKKQPTWAEIDEEVGTVVEAFAAECQKLSEQLSVLRGKMSEALKPEGMEEIMRAALCMKITDEFLDLLGSVPMGKCSWKDTKEEAGRLLKKHFGLE